MIRSLTRRWSGSRLALPLLLLLISRLALGLAYSQIVPVWEADNEDGHFAYARYLATHHTLLLPADDPQAAKIWESFQPPLYYLIVAPVVGWFDPGATFKPLAQNAYFANGDAGVNHALHPVSLSPAERSLELAVRAARALGVVISSLSLIPVFWTARRLWPNEPITAWFATILYAFWPQFIFTGSMVTNDVLVTALSAVALWLAVELALDGLSLRRTLALSAVVGAALLTKLNGLGLVPLAAGALLISLRSSAREHAQPWQRRTWLGAAGFAVLVAAALWLLSSLKLVNRQLFQLAVLRELMANLSPVSNAAAGSLLWRVFPFTFRTFLASYGWGNLETFPWLYGIWSVLALVAIGGLVAISLRLAVAGGHGRTLGTPIVWLWALLAAGTLAVVALTLLLAVSQGTIYSVPGRYLLPILPAILFLLIAGWRFWLPWPFIRRIAWKFIGAGIVLASLFSLVAVLAPAYARPLPQTRPADVAVTYRLGEAIELVGYNRPLPAHPGQKANISLCWQAIAPVKVNETVFLEVVGPDGQGHGRLVTYPGHGNYATSLWTVGVPFCDDYAVLVGSDFPAPAEAQLRVALLTTTDVNGGRLPVVAPDGKVVAGSAVSLPLLVVPARPPAPLARVANVRFGDMLALRDYGLTVLPGANAVRVDLRWEALRDLSTDYVIFVHLRDTPNHAYAQADSEPRAGWYPTSLWRQGEVVQDEHIIQLPLGPAPGLALYVGVVRRDTGERLPAFDSSSVPLPDNQAILDNNLILDSGPAK